jgi:hypothetical protein
LLWKQIARDTISLQVAKPRKNGRGISTLDRRASSLASANDFARRWDMGGRAPTASSIQADEQRDFWIRSAGRETPSAVWYAPAAPQSSGCSDKASEIQPFTREEPARILVPDLPPAAPFEGCKGLSLLHLIKTTRCGGIVSARHARDPLATPATPERSRDGPLTYEIIVLFTARCKSRKTRRMLIVLPVRTI